MSATFITMWVERIALEGPLQISSSGILATHMAPTVSLDWKKGRLVVDLEVSWVSPRHFMKYWGACRDSTEKCLESSANCSFWAWKAMGDSSKHNITGVNTSYMEEHSVPKQRKEAYPSFTGLQWEACLSFVKVLFILFTWTELWGLFTQWSC